MNRIKYYIYTHFRKSNKVKKIVYGNEKNFVTILDINREEKRDFYHKILVK